MIINPPEPYKYNIVISKFFEFRHKFEENIIPMSDVLDSRILVIGSGGLGCELLKILVLNGFKKITIVDFDKVVLSNLNRQFLFGSEDVHKFKSEISSKSIERWTDSKFSGFYTCKIEDLGLEILSQFDLIFSAVDSVETRRWLNCAFFEISRKDSHRLLVDGGSQNLYGHVRIIKPWQTSCIECSLSLFSSEEPLPCTLTNNVKTAEDCIYYSIYLDWELSNNLVEEVGQEKFLEYIYESSKKLAQKNNIEGVTFDLVEKICNKSIPNISTTNTIISSLMVNAVLNKELINQYNFYFYTGEGETSLSKFNLCPNEDCVVCQSKFVNLDVPSNSTLANLLVILEERFKLKSPNISSDEGAIYFDKPESLRNIYKHRLNMKLREISTLKDKIYVTNSSNPKTWVIYLNFF